MFCNKVGRALGMAVVGSLLLAGGGRASGAIAIETVPVGDAGNAADSSGFGAVGYNYAIGKYEVTAGQYTAFLNAVGATDTYKLYNAFQSETTFGSGITRSGVSGSYTYAVEAAFVNRPVNWVSFADAMRFANWLHNGQPTGAQDASTTEAGAYSVNGVTGGALNAVSREANWKWAVTSENEWYKAAYYDPNKAGGAGYWLYPTKNNTVPGRDLDDVSGNNANYFGTPFPIDSDKYTTLVGEFQDSEGPYNTFDQGGNVWEWNESLIGGNFRGLLGGALNEQGFTLHSGYRDIYGDPLYENSGVGFRVSQIPEPGSMALLTLSVAGMVLRRRRAAR